MKTLIKILCLSVTFIYCCDDNFNLTNQYRDIDCRDTSIEFCDENNSLFSPFVCDWVCRASHNTIINKCSSSGQFYSSISHQEAINLYNEVINYLSVSTFNYNCLLNGQYGTDFPIIDHLIPFDLNFITEDISCGWWDDGDGNFEIGYGWSENYKNGWGKLSINDNIDSDFNVAVHINHPLNDTNSDFISGYIFDGDLKPKWLISAGASRYSKVDSPEVNSNCDCSIENINYGADTARSEGIDQLTCDTTKYTTPMQVYHEALSDHIPNLYNLSIHGFSNLESDTLLNQYSGIPSFIITNGNNVLGNDCIPPDSITSTIYHYLNDYFSGGENYFNGNVDLDILENYNNQCSDINNSTDVAIIVQQEILCEHQPVTCSSSTYSPFAQYGGYQNPQGRYNNGYYDININVGDSLLFKDDIWTQIEIHKCVRDDITLYHKVASIISDAIIDCKDGMCIQCNESTPCSSNEGSGVDYSIYNFDCSSELKSKDFLSSNFMLDYSYPNPFNPITNISYNVPKASNINISIYNINGQLIEILSNEYQKPGKYLLTWNAKHYSSGTYFIKMIAGNFTSTQKIILIK